MLTYLTLIWLHFVADFLCQWDKMAINKSSDNKILALHCLIYSVFFLYFGVAYAILVGLSHFAIDYTTSRINKRLWAANERHWFFTVIGLDQALHLTMLIILL